LRFTLLYSVSNIEKPSDIQIELRLYKNDEVIVWNPTAEDIVPIMDKIIHLNKLLEEIDREEE
jgi:hypothetical protein